MSHTKRLIGVLVFASFIAYLIGCNKSDDAAGSVNVPENTMSYQINGTQTKFTTCMAVVQSSSDFNTVSVSALSMSDATKAMSLTVGSHSEIKQGFTFNETTASSSAEGLISYLDNSNGFVSLTKNDNPSAKVEVHITEKTATHVKGTFSGKLYAHDNDIDVAYTITDGQFNAKIQQY